MKPVIRLMSLLVVLAGCQKLEENSQQINAQRSNFPVVSVEMVLKQVSPHVYYVEGVPGVATDNEGFISNAGFVVTDEGVVVFDALGTPSLGAVLLEKIRSVTDKPVSHVIVSHYHADHIYGLQVFEEQGAQILAPAGAQIYIESETAKERLEERRFSLDPWVNETTQIILPDRYLEEQVSFKLGGVQFLVTPVGAAHSDGDLTLYIETDRVLFSGDIIFEGRVAFLGNANSRLWLQILEKMEAVQLTALVPGHGPVAQNPNESVEATRQYLFYLRQEMGRAVKEFIPFDEVYEIVDWSQFEQLPAFTEANRRNAYQVYLSIEAESFK